LKTAGLPSDQLDTMVLIDGDKYYVKSSAVLQIMKKMDRLWPFLFVFIVIPPFIATTGVSEGPPERAWDTCRASIRRCSHPYEAAA
ncbi:MAG: DUF393 protein, partial [Anaerolineales bacterium]|nr:DUF393 protein [Anaerolineales bacterium]